MYNDDFSLKLAYYGILCSSDSFGILKFFKIENPDPVTFFVP